MSYSGTPGHRTPDTLGLYRSPPPPFVVCSVVVYPIPLYLIPPPAISYYDILASCLLARRPPHHSSDMVTHAPKPLDYLDTRHLDATSTGDLPGTSLKYLLPLQPRLAAATPNTYAPVLAQPCP